MKGCLFEGETDYSDQRDNTALPTKKCSLQLEFELKETPYQAAI